MKYLFLAFMTAISLLAVSISFGATPIQNQEQIKAAVDEPIGIDTQKRDAEVAKSWREKSAKSAVCKPKS
jgi:hypothetical protein